MAKFHINDSDEVKRCSAQDGNCRFGDVEHYKTVKDAEKGLEERLSKNNVCGTLKKSAKTQTSKAIENIDTISANISKNYAHISILLDHLHNASDTGNVLELYYYNSPAGRQDLQSRIGMDETDSYAQRYIEIKEKIDHPDFNSSEVEKYLKNAEENVSSKIKDGAILVNNDFGQADDILNSEDYYHDNDAQEVRHYLVDQSYKWYSNLSTDEQTAIGSLTSNSFLRLQYSLGYENERYPAKSIFKDYVNIEEVQDNALKNGRDPKEALKEAFKKNADDLKNNVMKSFDKAPLLEEPVVTYRGTTINEVRELLGIYDGEEYNTYDKDHAEPTNNIVNDLVNGKYDGNTVNSESRLKKIPVSTSISPNRARSFGNGDVFLEIKRKTSTSPVVNGAWGSAEQEMLSNPLSNYRIVGATETDNPYGECKGVILQLEEIIPDEKE